MTYLRQIMLEELQRRNYSAHTAEAYIRALRDFAVFHHQPPDRLGPDQVRHYQLLRHICKRLIDFFLEHL
jgi:integrase/recombinase XerD